jgi:tetratricopeptide (TPR) repeat protein
LGRANRADYGDVAKAFIRIGKAYTKLQDLEKALHAFRSAQVGTPREDGSALHFLKGVDWDQVEKYSKEVDLVIKQTEAEKRRREEQAYIDPQKVSELSHEHGAAYWSPTLFGLSLGA